MAQAIVDQSSRLEGSGFALDLLTQYAQGKVRTYTKNNETRPCHIDGHIVAGIHRLVVTLGYTLNITSTNRWCDWTDSKATSFHWAYGGGGGLDIGKFKAPGSGTWNHAGDSDYAGGTKLAQIETLITDFFVGASAFAAPGRWEVGQRNCRPVGQQSTWQNQGFTTYADTCNHVHLSLKGPQRTYPKPPGTTGCNCPGFSYVPYPEAGYLFADVTETHRFYTEIASLTNSGIISGYSDGTFRSTDPVSRQATAAFLYRIAGSPPVTVPPVSPFSDVPTTSEFYKPIIWLRNKGITSGYDDGTFRPNAPVSRQAMAAFLFRFKNGQAQSSCTMSFSDVPVGAPFRAEICWLTKQTGISTGYSDNTFRPSENVSRQAMAAFLFRTRFLDQLPRMTTVYEDGVVASS